MGRTRQSCPIAAAVSGSQLIGLLAPKVEHLVAVEPKPELVTEWDSLASAGSRKIGQVPVCWDPDRDTAIKRAHEQFRWFGGGWKVNAELPGPAGFAGASQFVREQDVADSIACGPDIGALVDAVRPFVDAGFTDVALVQVGDERQREFLDFAERELVPALRQTYA